MGSPPAVKMVKAKHTAPAHCAKKKPSAAPKKAPKYYPAEDVKGKLGNFHNTSKPTKLRKSIQAGSVVIMLAGHFKGCRVVVLKKPKSANKKDDEQFFDGQKKENTIDESRKALQKTVDAALLTSISKTPMLKQYLASKFSLKNGQKPHEMTF